MTANNDAPQVRKSRGDLPPEVTHWTARGVFVIRWQPSRPNDWAKLYFAGRRLGVGPTPGLLALDVARGKFDEELGFSAVRAGTPDDVLDWNMLR